MDSIADARFADVCLLGMFNRGLHQSFISFFPSFILAVIRKSHQSGYLPFVADFRIHSVNRRVNDHHCALLMKSVFAQLPSELL